MNEQSATAKQMAPNDKKSSRKSVALTVGSWFYDENRPLGPRGGFGQVFWGWSADDVEVAVKRLHASAESAAHRELRIAEDLVVGEFDHVMPVLDAGCDVSSGGYYIVMDKADESLQDLLDRDHQFDSRQAASVMLEIVKGLLEVKHIVHRDLKPANVLSHGSAWKIADFGIARFVADATATDTLKYCLSAYYAAPEQWLHERANGATDVYALGCIGFALLTGQPPFKGVSHDDLREQHLNSDVAALPDSVTPQLRTLLLSMMRKAPASRPTAQKVREVLEQILDSKEQAGLGSNALAQVAAKIEGLNAANDRQASAESVKQKERERLAQTGRLILDSLVTDLKTEIQRAAPNANFSKGQEISLGSGVLRLPGNPHKVLAPGLFPQSGWDVVLGQVIALARKPQQNHGRDEGYQISSSLWYCKLPDTDQYRWYEVNYWGAFRNDRFSPYELTDNIRDADVAASMVMHIYDVCWGPNPIDDEDAAEFRERWLTMFAKAVDGSLRRPNTMPLRRHYWKDGQY
ncbi:serine/threonine protein kinase [Candidatus Obscuribacterales bacterium]|nr:serine/threonine protein kinase [Candidatus Obscuribacterales bacterium]